MKVKIHTLFQYLLETTEAEPEAIVGFSLSQSPVLGDFLDDLDPALSLDWNNRDFRGLPELRAHVLAQADLKKVCTESNVLITAGAAEANFLAIMQLLQPDDEIIVEVPGWPQAEVLAKAKGARVVRVRRHEAENWALSLDRMSAAVTDKTKLIFISNPNNPTGHLLTAAELTELARIAERVGAWLLVDEVYAGLEWSGPRAPAIAGFYERGITTGSVSKALGLQGLRTGWLICQDRSLLMDAVILRENSSEIMNIMGEVIAEVALRPKRYANALSAARQAGAENLARLNTWIETEPNLSWVSPQAGLIGLGRLPDGVDSNAIATTLLAEPYRTFLLPGSAYDQPGHIRLGVGGGAGVNLEKGLERVSAALARWPRTSTAGDI
ncbi:MAG: aminotransferase class I/II-fold pyridoxal phosphate-dependent enzyme [Pseudomonadota bacterium]